MIEKIDVSDMKVNSALGEGESVAVLVKWTNQTYHDENLRSMFTGQWNEKADVSVANTERHRQQYYPGLITAFDLSTDFLDASNAEMVKSEIQPTDIDYGEFGVALAVGDRIIVRKTLDGEDQSTIRHPWFARLHAVEQICENEFLTVSSSFDQIYIVDSGGNILKHLDVWAQGRNVNKFGHMMLRGSELEQTGTSRLNPEVALLREQNHSPQRANVITNPATYKGLGLPTYLTPTFVNHVAYDSDTRKVLATTLNSGECWQVDLETGIIEVVLDGLVKPHGLRKYGEGYMVTDTGRERILLLDETFKIQRSYDTSTFQDRKKGLEKALWLQNTTQLESGLLATISAPRQKVTLLDAEHGEYRDIPFDADWGIQTIKSSTEN